MRIAVLGLVSFVCSCDLFILCDGDEDCPESVPFCNVGVCSKDPPNGRPVEGEGEEGEGEEGEGEAQACDDDSDCGSGFCYDVGDNDSHFEADRVGTCVPAPEDDRSCPEAALFGTEVPTAGHAIFSGQAFRSAGSCTPGTSNIQVQVLFLGREQQLFEASLFVAAEGNTSSPNFAGASASTSDGLSGQLFGFDSTCYPDEIAYVAVAAGISSPTSNGLCIPVSNGSP